MQYRQLGSSGLKISVISLGGNVFGQHGGIKHFSDEAGTAALVHQAADLGVNFIDTADMYSNGVSETYVGKAVAGQRDRFIVASKVGMRFGDGPNDIGLSRGHIMASIEGSLRRLGTDYIDLYYAHLPDPSTPIEETLRAFDDLVTQGKVRYLGCSNFAGWQIAQAAETAERRGYTHFVVSQSPYNLVDRAIEAEVVPACLKYGLSIAPYIPLAQGILTGKYRRGETIPPDTRAWNNPSGLITQYMTDANLELVEKLDQWAQDQGHRVAELAIAWLLAKPYVCSVITGVTGSAQLGQNVKASDWILSEKQIKAVDEMLAGV